MSTSIEEKIFAALSANPVVGKTAPALLRKIAPACRWVKYRPGRRFIREGEAAELVYCLISGGVRVYHRGPTDEEIVVKLFGPPAFFGEADVLLGIEWLQTVEAVLPSEVVEIPGATFVAMLRHDHGLANAMVQDLATRLLMTSEHARTLAFGTAEARIAAFLLDYLALFGKPVDGGILIDVRLSQDALGRSLSLSRKTVQRTLQKWKDEGLLGRDSARYLVHDVDKLEALAARGQFGLAYKLDPADTVQV